MQHKSPDIVKLAAALEAEQVRCVLIGGFAMMLYGSTHVTSDIDLAIAFDPETTSSLVRALAPFNPVPDHLPEGSKVVWDERSIRQHAMYFRTDIGPVDILTECPGIDRFETLYEHAVLQPIGDSKIKVAALDDLIAMKEASTRGKDQAHLDELRELRKLIDQGE